MDVNLEQFQELCPMRGTRGWWLNSRMYWWLCGKLQTPESYKAEGEIWQLQTPESYKAEGEIWQLQRLQAKEVVSRQRWEQLLAIQMEGAS